MLKRNITYENFDGETVTDIFYFNLTKTEIITIQFDEDGGLDKLLERIVKTEDIRGLIQQFKKIILLSYGVKSDDGKKFIKNDLLREEFSSTAAFDSLFMELSTDDKAAVVFIQGILPKGLGADSDKPALPTPPAPPVT